MDQYKEFCRLRDYRKPGNEVPQHTEAEAFELATGCGQAQTFSALAELISHDGYAITCQSIGQYRMMLQKFMATRLVPEPVCHRCHGEKKLCSMNCSLSFGDKRRGVDVRRDCDDCEACHICGGELPMNTA